MKITRIETASDTKPIPLPRPWRPAWNEGRRKVSGGGNGGLYLAATLQALGTTGSCPSEEIIAAQV
jgi:hypothetical protein